MAVLNHQKNLSIKDNMIKRIIDIIFSSIIILLFLPIGIIIALILLLSGEGEVIYKQPRIGRYGKNFKMLKFVTMVKNSPNIGSGDITLKNDPRVLPFGKLLRKTKLNEFPQFINVFIGDMSIVGPRPLVKNQFDMIPEDLKTIIKKLKPGITGIGSIIFRDEEKYLTKNNNASNFYANEIVPFKAKLECWYEKHTSFLIDFLLILITILMIIVPNLTFYRYLLRDLPRHKIFNPN
tara:strand:+ start:1066 stop:1773 length:708 start_codon:yes stop_codon:yes gene_type:complete